MADLDEFFAKKDLKKKKKPKAGAKAVKSGGGVQENVDGTSLTGKGGGPASGTGPGAAAKGAPAGRAGKGDDGWIELADERTAQVNTGGRTVAEFKRDSDDKDQNGDGDAPVEKFSGWSLADKEDAPQEGPTEVGAAPIASYPTLADSADAPQVPKSRGSGSGTAATTRPRYASSGFAAGLRKMLAERQVEKKPASGDSNPAN